MTHLPYGMIIVSSFSIKYNEELGYYTIYSHETSQCPLCHGSLFYRNSKKRILISLVGEKSYYSLRRLNCVECGKLHTEIPAIIQPYKHYDSQTIQSVLDNAPSASYCVADNSTLRRWQVSFAAAQPDISQRLTSVYTIATDATAPVSTRVTIFTQIKSKVSHWLSFVMKQLIDAGHILCTQFAFCPYTPPAKVEQSEQINSEKG